MSRFESNGNVISYVRQSIPIAALSYVSKLVAEYSDSAFSLNYLYSLLTASELAYLHNYLPGVSENFRSVCIQMGISVENLSTDAIPTLNLLPKYL